MGRHYDSLTAEQRARVRQVMREQKLHAERMAEQVRIVRYGQPVNAETTTTNNGDTVHVITSLEER